MKTATYEAQVKTLCQALAESEQDCPASQHHIPVPPGPLSSVPFFCVGPTGKIYPDCGGSGKVPRFPGVRVPCSKSVYAAARGPGHVKRCPDCLGKGWVASTDMEVWLAMAISIGSPFNLRHRGGSWYACWGDPDDTLYPAENRNPFLALLLALKEWKEKADAK